MAFNSTKATGTADLRHFLNRYFRRKWYGNPRPWIDYIARTGFILQQGHNVADVGYFYGEEAPLSGLYGQTPVADAPRRYAYGFISPDALLNQLSVESGQIVSPGGARYAVLYLGGSSSRMTLTALHRIAALAEQGATTVGAAPFASPSLLDDKTAFATLVRRLWSGQPLTRVGAGRVLASTDIEAALAQLGTKPDFAVSNAQPDSDIQFNHRHLSDGDIYFVNNRKDHDEHFEARFRVTGKTPEIWHADTGLSEALSYRIEGAETVVPLDMIADDSFFVVFRKPSQAIALFLPKLTPMQVATLVGQWHVAFESARGAPPFTKLAALASLSENADPGIKYFSGVAAYTKRFKLPRGARAGQPLWLDLGQVADLAEVHVNGQLIGTVWHAPYRIDIGKAVREGRNDLDVRVADLWVNRLIGDAQPGATKITFTSQATYKPAAPLRRSGLIGPVSLEFVQGW